MSEFSDSAIRSREIAFRQKINSNKLERDKLIRIKREYNDLDTTLTTLPDKIKHLVMVPLGDLAFIPGFIINSNEITVALGENYFTKCSAKHARSIVSRRLEIVDKKIKSLDDEFEFIKTQLGFSSEILDIEKNKGDVVEIREEYNPEEFQMETTMRQTYKPKIEVLSEIPTKTATTLAENQCLDDFDDPAMSFLNELARLELEGKEPAEFQEIEEEESFLQEDGISEITEFEPVSQAEQPEMEIEDKVRSAHTLNPQKREYPFETSSSKSVKRALHEKDPEITTIQVIEKHSFTDDKVKSATTTNTSNPPKMSLFKAQMMQKKLQ